MERKTTEAAKPAEPTPRPWQLKNGFIAGMGENNATIAQMRYNPGDANGNLIVQAVNGRTELLDELQMALVTLDTVWQERDPKNIAAKCCATRIRAVLAKAKGGAA